MIFHCQDSASTPSNLRLYLRHSHRPAAPGNLHPVFRPDKSTPTIEAIQLSVLPICTDHRFPHPHPFIGPGNLYSAIGPNLLNQPCLLHRPPVPPSAPIHQPLQSIFGHRSRTIPVVGPPRSGLGHRAPFHATLRLRLSPLDLDDGSVTMNPQRMMNVQCLKEFIELPSPCEGCEVGLIKQRRVTDDDLHIEDPF